MAHKKPHAFVFFSAGPVGDHALILDFANRFFESTGKDSYIISKHPNSFLSDLLLPYTDHIHEIKVKGLQGNLLLLWLVIKSIFIPYYYVLILPIPLPRYMRLFGYFIRFCTRSRIIGLNSPCGFALPDGPKDSAAFLGKGNYIPAHVDTLLFYEQANALLEWLGHKVISHGPELVYIKNDEVFKKYSLVKKQYIVFHLVASSADKSLPSDRWHIILKAVMEKFPHTKLVFSGAKNDWSFIDESLGELPRENVINLCGKVSMQELLNVYTESKVTVCVHTGNAIIVNMLHVPAVMVNIKGVYMFKYHYNKNAVDITSTLGCTCNPYERHCTMVPYKGKEYMACLFNINDQDVIDAIVEKYTAV